MDAAPYEKMYMIDEAEWMKLKNVHYPTAAEDQPPNDPPPDESAYETDDDDEGGDDEEGVGSPQRFQAPAQVPKVNPTTISDPRGLQLPSVDELRQNQLNQELKIENAQFEVADKTQQIAEIDAQFDAAIDSVHSDMQALHESVKAMEPDVDLDAPGKEQFKNLEDWARDWVNINHMIGLVLTNPEEYQEGYLEELHKTEAELKKSQYHKKWVENQTEEFESLQQWKEGWEALMDAMKRGD